jgi:hypothetical protein
MENFLQPNFISTATNASISQTLSTRIIDTRETVPEWKARAKIACRMNHTKVIIIQKAEILLYNGMADN